SAQISPETGEEKCYGGAYSEPAQGGYNPHAPGNPFLREAGIHVVLRRQLAQPGRRPGIETDALVGRELEHLLALEFPQFFAKDAYAVRLLLRFQAAAGPQVHWLRFYIIGVGPGSPEGGALRHFGR